MIARNENNENGLEELKLEKQRSKTVEERNPEPTQSPQKKHVVVEMPNGHSNEMPVNKENRKSHETNDKPTPVNGKTVHQNNDEVNRLKKERMDLLQRLRQANEDLISVIFYIKLNIIIDKPRI